MNDATPWIDPELIAAGQLLQSRGLVAPDRTQAALSEVRAATDRIGAFLGEGSIPLERERDLTLPGPHGQVPCRLYLPDDAERPPLLVFAHGGGFGRAASRAGMRKCCASSFGRAGSPPCRSIIACRPSTGFRSPLTRWWR